MTAPVLELGLVELAAAIRDGAVTAEAATSASLAALDGRGHELNAVARLWQDEALADAARADRERAAGRISGPLHGVPLAHKDMFHRKGRLAEMGTRIYRGNVATTTATVLEKLDAAGALDIGRLNMVEFALGVTGHNPHTGHPRNAWDPTKVTAGSTSGGATSVAARLTWATLGSDTGGSIRVPASVSGITGIKPTYGRVSRAGAMPLSFSLDHVGPLARSAEDCALMLSVIAGADPRDRTTSPRPVPDYRQGIDRGVKGLRIAVARDCFDVAIDPLIAGLETTAMAVLCDLGGVVQEQRLPAFAPYNAIRRIVVVAECAALHRELVVARRDDYNPQTTSRMEPGFAVSSVDYLRALELRATLLRSFCTEVFGKYDVVALPTVPVPTPKIADTDTGGDASFLAVSNAMGALIGVANYLGLPSLSTPMGFDASGMPVGLQLIGRPFAEALLLRAAHAFERATGHGRKRPLG